MIFQRPQHGPAGLSKTVIVRLNAEINKASAAVRERFAAIGAEPAPVTPQQFADFIPEGTREMGRGREAIRRQDRLKKL